MKRLLMLGGSLYQTYAIKEAKRLGYYVITCDYLPSNPGHKYADDKYVRIAFTLNEDKIQEGVRRIGEFVKNLNK